MSVARSVTIVVGLLLLLTWLSWRAINPHAEQFDRGLDELDHLGLVQDALYRDLLATRIGLLRNYDSLVSEMNALRYSVAHLQEIGSSDGQTGEAISRVRASIDREEQLVESFKRENAVLRNSLSFFARFETRSDSRELDVAIGAAATAILHLTLDTSPDAITQAAMRLEDLKRQAERSGQSVAVQPLLAHGSLLHRLLPSVDTSLKEAMVLAQKTDLSTLRRLIQLRQLSSRNEARSYRALLYTTSLVLLTFLVQLGVRLKALVGDLHRRVALEHLLADISMQFVNAEPDGSDTLIQRAIVEFARHVGCHRAYLVVPGSTANPYLWQRTDAPFPPGWPEAAPELAIQMRDGEDRAISVRQVSRLPAGRCKSLLEALGISGWTCATGIDRNGRLIALGLEVVSQEGSLLKSGELVLLRMLLDILIHAIDRRSVEEERVRLHRRVQHASRMEKIGTFTSGIAHNFNNILGGILGHAEMMEELIGGRGDKVRHLSGIRRSAERGRDLIGQMLVFGRYREIRRLPVSIVDLVGETISLLQVSLAIGIELEMRSVAGDAIVNGEAAQLQQVLMNLCRNAASAMGGTGRIQVDVELLQIARASSLSHDEIESGDYVRISVVDAGVGMDGTVLDRIFEPFFTTKPDGNGLGLATVREIVREHGGGINVESLPGEGSRFEVWLPASVSTAAAAPSPKERLKAHIPGQGEVVMLVGPDKDRLLGEEEKLAALGYEAVGFSTAEAAIQASEACPDRFDFVVVGQLGSLDYSLEVANDLHEALPATPIIVAARSSSDIDPDKLLAAGISDVVRWPILTEEIAASLSQFSNASGPTGPVGRTSAPRSAIRPTLNAE
jgi:signal transduction histidine kinase